MFAVSSRTRYRRALCAVLVSPFLGAVLGFAGAHAHGPGDHHGADGAAGLHFSHPIVVESPSPDTKLRLDYAFADGDLENSHLARLEGEYAFAPRVSVEVDLPWRTVREPGGPRRAHLDSAGIALKLVAYADPRRGLLLGGGLEFGLPTGSDAKGIGSSREIEIEPFLDLGYKNGALELVGFLRLGFPLNVPPDERRAVDAELAYEGSLLYHLTPRLAALVEVSGSRVIDGEEKENGFLLAPGIKYRPFRNHALAIGASIRVPLDHGRAFDIGPMLSAFYHF